MPLPLSASAVVTQAKIVGGLLAIMWVLELVDQVLLQHRLDRLALCPAPKVGLRGILFAPLLHGTWQHLLANTIPFAVLGWLTLLRGVTEFTLATVVIWLVSGAGVWLLAAPRTLHIGASGIIFGYFGFLLSRSYFEQDLFSAGIALVVALLYGPLIWGILPSRRRGISWQGHLFGFVGGILTARYLPALKQWFATFQG